MRLAPDPKELAALNALKFTYAFLSQTVAEAERQARANPGLARHMLPSLERVSAVLRTELAAINERLAQISPPPAGK
jgi:hypothetical protein